MPRRRLGQVLDDDRGGGDVDHPLLVLEIEMVMVGGIGVEIAAGRVDRHFAQQPGLPELVQRIVDGREGDIHFGGMGFGQQLLGAHMPVLAAKQDFGERDTLPRGPRPAMRSTAVRQGRCEGTLLENCRYSGIPLETLILCPNI